MAWKPIETAPKDGTCILATGKGYGGRGGWFIADVKYDDGFFCMFDPTEDGWTEPVYDLTHWMPLPEPPEA